MPPKISVIVPCYNQEKYLDECLQSLMNQSFTDWECIVVNDGSTDGTADIAKRWVEKDSRVIYIDKENGGISSARNAGLEKASGDYIQFLDSDDTLDSEKFSKSLSGSTEYELIVSQFTIYRSGRHFPGYNKIDKDYLTFDSIVFGWNLKFTIPIHCVLISKRLLEGFRFDLTLQHNEDWLMWIYIMKNHPKTMLIDEPLAHYRKENNTQSLSSDYNNILLKRVQILPVIKKLYGEEIHDKLSYHMINVYTTQLIQLKSEFNKITGGKVISAYLAFKKYYYKIFQKKG
ncbi:glycosyltransferase family 2 protein [Chryseobacterium indologenes]|uniref:glycosyltransferase family 2 protein n=1 Tax=Chryseobacterium indologenes TaxID=253 RepID=UPI0040582100